MSRSEESYVEPRGSKADTNDVATHAESGRENTESMRYPRFEVDRSTIASSAVEVGQSILERYERTDRWELVVSEVLDLSGSAWGAILRRNDGAQVSVILALPEVLGRSVDPGNPTVVTELIVDVEREKRSMHE